MQSCDVQYFKDDSFSERQSGARPSRILRPFIYNKLYLNTVATELMCFYKCNVQSCDVQYFKDDSFSERQSGARPSRILLKKNQTSYNANVINR